MYECKNLPGYEELGDLVRLRIVCSVLLLFQLATVCMRTIIPGNLGPYSYA